MRLEKVIKPRFRDCKADARTTRQWAKYVKCAFKSSTT